MQDQGKRLLVAVALALGVMLAWNAIFSPKNKDQKAKEQQQQQQTTQTTQQVARPTTLVATKPGGGVIEEKTIALKFPKLVATFSNRGGVLKSWQLTDKRYEHDDTKGELLPEQGAFAVGFVKGSTYVLPENQDWVGQQTSDHTVEYRLETPELAITKTFELFPEELMIRARVETKTKATGAVETLALTSYEQQDPKKAEGGSSRIAVRAWESATLHDGSINSTPVTSLIKNGPRYVAKVQWTGFEQPYLLVGYAPHLDPAHEVDKYTFATNDTGLMRTDMVFGPPGTQSGEVVAYLGPKNYSQLDNADRVAGFPTGFKETIDLGWFAFIGRPLLWLLLKFHAVFGNWGIAILLLTLLVKGATLYWTTKSMRSMKAMAVLGPQMKALQEKYKGDKQRQQLETMALYKQHNVNPLAGCLPILLQMPIWLALYRMLMNAGELYQQPFIHGWIDDLTDKDPTYILPIVLVITMFAQARLQPTTVDPSQKLQQRMMQYGMPLMFGLFCFWAPAGLTLYIFTNTCLSALHSIYMNKYDKQSLELAAKLKANKEAMKAGKEATTPAPEPEAVAKEVPAATKPRNQQQRRKKGGRR